MVTVRLYEATEFEFAMSDPESTTLESSQRFAAEEIL